MKNSPLKLLLLVSLFFAGFASLDEASARRAIPTPVVGTPTPISAL